MDKKGQAGVQITGVALILMGGEREGRWRERGGGDMSIRGECDCCSLVTIRECAAQTLMCFSHISTATSPTSF